MFNPLGREFLVFLSCLAASGLFWLLMALNETHEREYGIPVELHGVPDNVVLTAELPDTAYVTLRDKGFALLAYSYGDRLKPVRMAFQAVADKKAGRGGLSQQELNKAVARMLFGTTSLVAARPKQLAFQFNYGQSQKYRIKLAGKATAEQGRYIARTTFYPEAATVYASPELLDSIKWVETEPVSFTGLADTLTAAVRLKKIRGAKVLPEEVTMTLFTDVLTEETMEVEITAEGMPSGAVLRTFPSKAKVRFAVAASEYRAVTADKFKVVADYKSIASGKADKCKLTLVGWPQELRRASLETEFVDYLVERK